MNDMAWLLPAIFMVAALYSSVGHGGASGYLALLALIPAMFNPAEMSTTALVLNVVVAGTALVSYVRAGHFSWPLALPFVSVSIPMAFIGGTLAVRESTYSLLLGGSLLIAAVQLVRGSREPVSDRALAEQVTAPDVRLAVPTAASIGLLSGIVGIGGGIFLSPVMIILGWATPKRTSACAAAFILANSLAGLGGRAATGALEFDTLWPLVIVAAAGGLAGSRTGSLRLSDRGLRTVLAVVLAVAALKLILGTWLGIA